MSPTVIPGAAYRLDLVATLRAPLHHGAGTSGNAALLRTQDVIQPDGRSVRVPFVSGASVRHGLRDVLAWRIAHVAGIEEGSLTKSGVDLAWTGGAVTQTGSEVDLEMMRRVERVMPSLSLLGYAALSDIIRGTLRVSDLILACRENAGRIPEGVAPDACRQRAAVYRSEEFGTRHDVRTGPQSRFLQDLDALLDGKPTAPSKTTQMIFEHQVLKAGSVLHGTISLSHGATDEHRRALGAALALWAPDGETYLAAKSAQGYGLTHITGIPDTVGDDLAWFDQHVAEHADDIKALIADLSK